MTWSIPTPPFIAKSSGHAGKNFFGSIMADSFAAPWKVKPDQDICTTNTGYK
jgi:hypothetical protein